MNKCIFFLATLILMGCEDSTIAISQDRAQIGHKVPNLDFTQLLNSSEQQKQLYDFNEELLILDFWATWCGPCIQAFPKMGKIQSNFEGKVKVIAITDDPTERIKLFLQNKPQNFTIAIDEDRKINDYFKHKVIPHYVILDKNKVVKAIVDGSYITEENISKLLLGENVAFTEKKEQLDFDESIPLARSGEKAIYQSTLLPYQQGAPGLSNMGHKDFKYRVFVYNSTFPAMLRMAYDFPYSRTIENFKHPERFTYQKENQYCYELITPQHLQGKRLNIMQHEIALLSGLTATIETVMTDVYVLQKKNNSTITLTASTKKPDPNAFIVYGKGITLQGQPITDLASFYENNLNIPVIDETGYEEVYDIDVAWYEEDIEQSLAQLDPYGLVLIKSKRPVDFLKISD